MRSNPNITFEQLTHYLSAPDSERPFARYRAELLDAEPCFTADEVTRLSEIARMPVATYSRFGLSKLLIDLSWASSRLEGNTYTQLDTQVLIEYGKTNDGKPAEYAAMILNHKMAIEFMMSTLSITEENIKKIHAYLADNTMATESRHFLDPDKCGVVRSFTENGLFIGASSYMPPQAEDRPPGFIDKEFSRIIQSANKLSDPINQSFFLMTRIPYLQAFYDANKRTSRISCNIPLLEAGLAPLSFVNFDEKKYMACMITFYELGDERLAKSAFVDAYLSSAFRYMPFGEDARYDLSADWDKHIAAARNYVIDGVRESEPVWMMHQGESRPAIVRPDETF